MKTIRVMTFNVQTGKRLGRIIRWLHDVPHPDIMCFQEYPKERISDLMASFGKDLYGYRFAPSMLRRKRTYGVLTVFQKELYRCTASSIFSLGVSRFERRVFKSIIPRSCLVTTHQCGKTILIVANTHLVPFAVNKYKYLQAEAVVRKLTNRQSPSIVLGDLNISSIFGKRKLITLMRAYGYETERKRLSTHRVAVVKHQFDYIFTKQCKISSLSVVRVRFSDHYPVFAICVI